VPESPIDRELALDVSAASSHRGPRRVLHDVSLAVPAGAIVVLAGPNGAGKSSLLATIGGRLGLDGGAIRISGLPAGDARRAGRLGLVPQDVALVPQLSVYENLRLWGIVAGAPVRSVRARIEHGLTALGLSDRATTRVDRLSGGMRRRVNLLAGLLHRPALLLLDEPTVGIDRDSRDRVHQLLGGLRDEGVGVLMVTHDLDDVTDLADGVVVLAEGAVVAAASMASLVAPHIGVREVTLVCADDGGAAALRAEGFVPDGGRRWVGPPTEEADVAALERHLDARGVRLTEIGLRRPTLSSAVARLVASHRERAR